MSASTKRRSVLGGLAATALLNGGARAQGATDPADLAYWQAIGDSQDPADYRDYLAQFPKGTFAPLARSRMARLGGTTTAAPAARPAPAAAPAAAPAPAPDPIDTVQEQLLVTPNPAHVGEKVRIAFKNLPAGGRFDVISVVRAGSPDTNPTQNRDDMKILASEYTFNVFDQGYAELGPFAPGRFEARYVTSLYNDDHKMEVRTRTIFTVR